MHPEIEKLIEMALADGQVTEKERAIILRKAEKLDIDVDEVEMYLEGKISKKSFNNLNSSKHGELKKCPSCGSIVESFTVNCFDCGFEFRGLVNLKYIEKLKNELDNLIQEEKISFDERLKKSSIIERLDVGCNPIIFEANLIDKQINLISQFPFPTSKEDILEFFSFALPLSKQTIKSSIFMPLSIVDKANNRLANAWRSKCEQAIIKARFSMNNDKKTLQIIEEYANHLNK